MTQGSFSIAVLPGDGIGPEVTREAVRVLKTAADLFGIGVTTDELPIGANAVHTVGSPFPDATRAAVQQADAVLLGAVGDPSLDNAPRNRKPETGLLELRALLGVYANLRPVAIHPALTSYSPLRPERLRGVDLLIVRELLGGLYYGEPRGKTELAGVNTMSYSVSEIERVARVAFEAARKRRRVVTSVDKANVLEVSQLWRETVTRIGRDYTDVRLEHLYVDYAAMRLVADPATLDVVLTENMFGDILSDEAAVLVGSLGMLPSASLGAGAGLFEPIHGSAPTIAGQNIANPIGAIASVAMLLRYGLKRAEAADAIDRAIRDALDQGARTKDIAQGGDVVLGTKEMGARILGLLERRDPGIQKEDARTPRRRAGDREEARGNP